MGRITSFNNKHNRMYSSFLWDNDRWPLQGRKVTGACVKREEKRIEKRKFRVAFEAERREKVARL